MTRVLITGVRGKTGSELARSLADHPGVEVVGGTRDPGSLELPGVTVVAFDWHRPDRWAAALDGVNAVYLVRPDIEDAPERIASLLTQTRSQTRLVLLSDLSASDLDPGAWAVRVERAVTDHARDWTLLRPSWFMQVFTDERFYLDAIRTHGRVTLPAGDEGVSWIDTRDIAAVAERTLLDDGHSGHAYELTGPEAVDLPTTVALLSTAAGRTLAHDDSSVAGATAGLEGWEARLFTDTYEDVLAGVYETVTNDVERVTGRSATPLQAFITEHAGLLADR